MVFPVVLPRMKQSNNFICLGIHSSNVRPFMVIARKTREREVPEFISPVMFASNNVIDLTSEEIVLLWHPAVFTDRVRPLPHLVDERWLHPSLRSLRLPVAARGVLLTGATKENGRHARSNQFLLALLPLTCLRALSVPTGSCGRDLPSQSQTRE